MLPHIERAYLAFIKGLALLFLVAMSSCEALSRRKLRRVNMTNVLGERLELTIHCKSKDDDLGIIKIPFNGYYSFRFHPNAFDTTLFFCNTAWRGQSHWFDIYMSERDRYKCPNQGWREEFPFGRAPLPLLRHHRLRHLHSLQTESRCFNNFVS
ncbi:hypothetical protein MANES_03G154100v8 [Manihot esculenta]|uniref:Uncharacterized protein n=1 Tax=Manihot esculenta TaxID=3983 RepID=A0ACB7I0A0_MANES|nr:hypothetical protein MANES_03G154100v8 [Manihot esculenta]